MKHNFSQAVAFGGVTAALALVIMGLGGLIPIAGYVCVILCSILLQIVFLRFGSRIAWAWYTAVALLSLIMGPDKEAALMFIALGYYPILKSKIDRLRFKWLWKAMLFNICVTAVYGMLILIVGLQDAGFEDFTLYLGILLLVMGNISFFLLDRFLSILTDRITEKPRKGRTK